MNTQVRIMDIRVAPQATLAGVQMLPVGNQTLDGRMIRQLFVSQRDGKNVLPWLLGLTPLDFMVLAKLYLPDLAVSEIVAADRQEDSSEGWQKGQLRQQLLDMRRDEWMDVRDLLLSARKPGDLAAYFMAGIVAAGCLGGDHLWRDLGLPNRQELGLLLNHYFGPLAEKNTQDMKWKKFFYKQLCEQQGGYVCRSPSCEDCVAYNDCFGPEL